MALQSVRSVVSRLNAAKSNILSFTFKRYVKAQSVNFAKKVEGGANKKSNIEVETDPHILCSRLVGGNYLVEGEDPVLGADEDYPEWLWDLKLNREATPLEEMSQDDPKYWARLKKLTIKQNLKLKKTKKL